jgi:hypothetical protein
MASVLCLVPEPTAQSVEYCQCQFDVSGCQCADNQFMSVAIRFIEYCQIMRILFNGHTQLIDDMSNIFMVQIARGYRLTASHRATRQTPKPG